MNDHVTASRWTARHPPHHGLFDDGSKHSCGARGRAFESRRGRLNLEISDQIGLISRGITLSRSLVFAEASAERGSFMSQEHLLRQVEVGLQLSPLDTAYQGFLLSRQAMPCTDATMQHYRYTAGVFVTWLQRHGITDPKDITAAHVREWLAENAGRLKDTSLHARARGVRTFLRFLYAEGEVPTLVKVQMPRLEKRRLPCLEADDVHRLLRDCDARKAAIIRLLANSGIRAAELCGLTWGDLDMQTGLLFVHRGKGRKDRVAVVGPKTRRALLRYRGTLKPAPTAESPLIQGRGGRQLTPCWLSHMVHQLGKRRGLYVTPHALRRTFAIQALRGGMNVLALQRLLGHAGLSMTQHYCQLLDEDLIRAHENADLELMAVNSPKKHRTPSI